jgi:hypothetical protein
MTLWDFDITGGAWHGWVLMGVVMVAVWGLAVTGIVVVFHGFGARNHQPKDRPDNSPVYDYTIPGRRSRRRRIPKWRN